MQKCAIIFASVLYAGIASDQPFPPATNPDLGTAQPSLSQPAYTDYADYGRLWKQLETLLGQGVLKTAAPADPGT